MAVIYQHDFSGADSVSPADTAPTTDTDAIGNLTVSEGSALQTGTGTYRQAGNTAPFVYAPACTPTYCTIKGSFEYKSDIASDPRARLVGRFTNGSNFIIADVQMSDGDIVLGHVVAGSYTVLATATAAAVAWSTGQTKSLWLVIKDDGGQKCEVWYDGALAIAATAETDNTSNKRHASGVYDNGSSSTTTGMQCSQFIIDDAFPSTGGSGAVTLATPTIAAAGTRSLLGSGTIALATPTIAGTGPNAGNDTVQRLAAHRRRVYF